VPYKVTYFFQQTPGKTAGWTESFYNNAASLQLVITRANTLRPSLHKVHGFQTGLTYQRISNVSNFREVDVQEFPLTSPANPNTSNLYGSDYPTNALLLLTQPGGDIRYTVRQWIKGIPDGAVIPPGVYNPAFEAYLAQIDELRGKLTQGTQNWACRVVSKNLALSPIKLITAVDLATGIVTSPAHLLETGQRVRISKTKKNKYINRIWQVEVLSASTYRLITWDSVAAGTKPADGGQARLQDYEYPSITVAKIIRATKKNVGRPFGLFVGRQKRRAL